MRAAVLLLAVLVSPVLAATGEQTITPVVPNVEQRVDPITPPAEQRVEVLSGDGTEQVKPVSHSVVGSVANGVAKGVIVVLGAAVAVGSTLAMLLFL